MVRSCRSIAKNPDIVREGRSRFRITRFRAQRFRAERGVWKLLAAMIAEAVPSYLVVCYFNMSRLKLNKIILAAKTILFHFMMEPRLK